MGSLSLEVKRLRRTTTHLHRLSRFRIYGAVPPFCNIPTQRAQGLHFYFTFISLHTHKIMFKNKYSSTGSMAYTAHHPVLTRFYCPEDRTGRDANHSPPSVCCWRLRKTPHVRRQEGKRSYSNAVRIVSVLATTKVNSERGSRDTSLIS